MAGKDFQHWAEDMMRILLEDIEETKKLTKETRALTIEAKKHADSAWERASIARLELKELRKSWWKKLFGINGE